MYFSFLFRMILSKGPCFMLIPSTKRSSVFQHFFIRVFPHLYVSFSSSHCSPLGRFSQAMLSPQRSSMGQALMISQRAIDISFCRKKALHRKTFFPKWDQPFCAWLLPTVSRQGNNHLDLLRPLEFYKFMEKLIFFNWPSQNIRAANLRWTRQTRRIRLLPPC